MTNKPPEGPPVDLRSEYDKDYVIDGLPMVLNDVHFTRTATETIVERDYIDSTCTVKKTVTSRFPLPSVSEPEPKPEVKRGLFAKILGGKKTIRKSTKGKPAPKNKK